MSIIQAIVTRRNSLSGVKYSEEPAIFAWELINEPRCESSSSAPALEVNDHKSFKLKVQPGRFRLSYKEDHLNCVSFT